MNGDATVGNGFHTAEDQSAATANHQATVPNVGLGITAQQPVTPSASNVPSSENVASTGRRNRKRTSQCFPMVESSPNSKKKAATGSSATKKSAKKKKSATHDDLSWICCECKEAEAMEDPESDLAVCEGYCHRPFHTICAAGFDTSETQNDDEPWLCGDCQAQQHQCSLCQEFGQDNVDVYCCKIKGCGLFFHESCLTSSYNVDIKLVPLGDNVAAYTNGSSQSGQARVHAAVREPVGIVATNDDEENAVPDTRPEFKCPAHQCWTCTEEMVMIDDSAPEETTSSKIARGKGKKRKKKKKKQDNIFARKNGPLIRCLECPIAYHISCIPPFARFHELALLCHDHATTCKLPTLDMATSLQGKYEREADKKLESMAATSATTKNAQNRALMEEKNAFFFGLHGDTLSREEIKLHHHMEEYIEKHDEEEVVSAHLKHFSFCLPCDLKDEVHSKPPSFRLVHSLRYNQSNRPKRKEASGDVCRCKANGLEFCDENCHNQFTLVECVGDSSKTNGVKNPYWNCDLGPGCRNRGLGRRQFAKCKPKREQGKGWGLITLAPLKEGDLVQEYVGEVIDEKEKEARLTTWSKDHPNDPNFYVMQLDTGWYIDARVEANLSRFINHSCDPNCILRPMNVSGYNRIGIFTTEDVSPGVFLSYDYQFDTKHGDKFVCRCGAVKCRGTMKGGKHATDADGDEQEKTIKEALLAARAREEKDRRYLEEAERTKRRNFSQVDMMIPAHQYPSESVAAGPHDRYRSEGTGNGVFLWRNIIIGGHFSYRATLLGREKKAKERRALSHRPPLDVFGIAAVLNSPKHVDAARTTKR